ncbi:putative flavonoid 3-hydroxylase [Stachybotrys elegans]|uniref:Flavonoid 3-hydroxylase n=1 Tax=Stachybotrys elegans TaxID=80388 RepID=A0A8K0SJZ2_9HYPO|nr:putative flavonoid 3-hydroxylase [Stachybotrys elegans]
MSSIPGLHVMAVVLLYTTALITYRLYFHPLAKFPGPKLAAATGWYEAYFDLWVLPRGQFMHEIKRMHQLYGPIVRINPNEIHIEDSSWSETLYSNAANGTRDKYPPAAHMTGTPDGVFGTVSHAIHRRRRAAISPLFSTVSVARSETRIYDMVDILLNRISEQIRRDGWAELRLNYLAFTTDTLTDFCFTESMQLLQDEKKAAGWKSTIQAIALLTPLIKQFTWVIPLALALPVRPLEIIIPDIARVVKLRRDMESQALLAQRKKHPQNDNIFESILTNRALGKHEKHHKRMAQEGFVAIAAGGETTGRVLTTITFYILENKEHILPRLREELVTLMPDPEDRPSVSELKNLPWLSAIIKESLRITALVTSRLPLVSPNESLVYKDWVIPRGTPVSMTLRSILLDPDVFDQPMQFRPSRWLSNNPDLEHISRNYLPFGRGSRMCLGMNLALAELYITTASIFRRLQLELHETYKERDIDIVRDCFIGEVSPESKGVRVKF